MAAEGLVKYAKRVQTGKAAEVNSALGVAAKSDYEHV